MTEAEKTKINSGRFVLPGEAPLSDEQQAVVDSVLAGENVFITGSAGTGKSLVLKYIKHYLGLENKEYAVTAPTGAASILIEGQTIHSWAKIGTGDKPLKTMVEDLKGTRQEYCYLDKHDPGRLEEEWEIVEALRPWINTDVLIIDEISMVAL